MLKRNEGSMLNRQKTRREMKAEEQETAERRDRGESGRREGEKLAY